LIKTNRTLKGIFVLFITLILGALAVASFIAINSIGRIDEVEKASEDLDVRNLRFTPSFRAQIYRLQAVSLRARITGDKAYTDRFALLRKDFEAFLASRREIFDQEDELEQFESLESKLALYFEELTPRDLEELGESELESVSEIQERISGMSGPLQRLGDGLPSLELRWQLQRCYASLMVVHAKGTLKQVQHFEENLVDLRETLSETKTQIGTEERKVAALNNFTTKLDKFASEVERITARWVRKGSSENRFQRLEQLQDLRDELVEIAQALGDGRRETFNSSLKEYKSLVDGMKYSIFIALGMLFVSLFIMGWLARLAFLKPIETSLTEAEETVTSTSNLATVGTLAAGVAHEIRNPLTAIKARLFALGEIARGDDAMLRQVSAIQSETNRMEHIVQDFLNFARPSEANLVRGNVSEFLDDVHTVILPEIELRGVSFVMGRTVEAITRIDKEQLKQVFLNLVRNAAEACPEEGGEIVLSSTRNGDSVFLAVSDNGKGIPAEYLDRIFDPFFSKKKGGTGLGLAICRNIIANHHGKLTCESTEGKGTTFTIELAVAS
jgi:signal transduction histidine kinase